MVEIEDQNRYIMGRKKSSYFQYHRKLALVVGVRYYAQLRELNESYAAYADLESTEDDVRTIRAGLIKIGFIEDEINVIQEPNFK